jgi:cytochrome c553/cytochrome c5
MRRLERLAVAVFVLAAGLFAVAVATGLLRPAELLGTAIATMTGIAAPPLDDPAMIRRGAGHYDRFCASCHGSPERPDRGEALNFTPPAPTLHLLLGERPPESLFLTVKHGVSGTAMPAWPTQHRDDEIWDVVAFLTVLPKLDNDAYRSLAGVVVGGSLEAPLIAACARCHGVDGRGSPDGAFPRLDIQTPEYLFAALASFRSGARASGFMQSVATGLTDDELREAAQHFGSDGGEADIGLQDGEPLFALTPIPCRACHGPPPVRPQFPRLTGQYQRYVDLQLRLFVEKGEQRGGTAFAPLMHEVARTLKLPSAE